MKIISYVITVKRFHSDLQNNGSEDCSDSSDEDVIDHSKHLHADPILEAILMDVEGEQFVAGNVIHDHPMEVRINWVMQSADGISSGDNLATDMNGAWTFDIDVEDRSENISITFRAHNLPEDTWSDNITIKITADVIKVAQIVLQIISIQLQTVMMEVVIMTKTMMEF